MDTLKDKETDLCLPQGDKQTSGNQDPTIPGKNHTGTGLAIFEIKSPAINHTGDMKRHPSQDAINPKQPFFKLFRIRIDG